MKTKEIGFIGGGRITKIILKALKNESVDLESTVVYDPDAEVCSKLKQQFPGIQIADSQEAPARQSLVVLAVHPPVLKEIFPELKTMINIESVVLSLAPKFTISKISEALGTERVVRMIPNATSYINEGYNPITFASGMDEKTKNQLMKFLKPLGKNFETDESKLESYAIVSAMLPTYFWFQWQEMENIARETGLSPKEAQKAVKVTLKKAWELYYTSDLTAEEVMDLIPVKPMRDDEDKIKESFRTRLLGLFEKIKP
ncbi:MAG: NAD(P)-binding domain-containing protein [Bacteroidales bacterium]|nr:NAD(P)-binding domain-containing protein [Bacteroidales bacterium]